MELSFFLFFFSSSSSRPSGGELILFAPHKLEEQQKFRSKHIKCSKWCNLLGQNITCKFSGKSPLSSYKITLQQHLNDEKWWKKRWTVNPLICLWLSYIVFLSSAGLAEYGLTVSLILTMTLTISWTVCWNFKMGEMLKFLKYKFRTS